MEPARVSVVIPVFNAGRWLARTLESLDQQTYPNWELIAVDDGSTDESLSRLRAFSDRHPGQVRIVVQRNAGPSAARNRGIDDATGDFLAFLDADDLWAPEKLQNQVELLTNSSNLVGCTCDYRLVDASGRELRSVGFRWTDASVRDWVLLEGPGPGLCSTLLVRRKALQLVGPFDGAITNAEDAELSLRLLRLGPLGAVPRILMDYRISDTQQHRDLDGLVASAPRLLAVTGSLLGSDERRRLLVNARTYVSVGRIRQGAVARGLGELTDVAVEHPYLVTRFLGKSVLRRLKQAN